MIEDVQRPSVSISDQIIQRLHSNYPGLKHGKGLDWLVQTLTDFKARGFSTVVKSLLANMHDLGSLPSFLLELEFLDCLIRTRLDSGKIRDEHTIGGNTKPVDASFEDLPTLRADFQCKYINSYENELLVNGLWHWIDTNFSADEPGSLVRIQASTEANQETIAAFKPWFENNRLALPFDEVVTFKSDLVPGSVQVERSASKTPGTYVGIVTASVPEGHFAVKEDIDLASKAILSRCEQSAPTFAYSPSPIQHNIVVFGVDSLAMLSERQFFLALYGHETLLSDHMGNRMRDGLGLFDQGKLDFVSAVFLLEGSMGNYEVIVFPNPRHKASIDFWLSLPGFRLGQQSRRPLLLK